MIPVSCQGWGNARFILPLFTQPYHIQKAGGRFFFMYQLRIHPAHLAAP
jgi:hypothetical protein